MNGVDNNIHILKSSQTGRVWILCFFLFLSFGKSYGQFKVTVSDESNITLPKAHVCFQTLKDDRPYLALTDLDGVVQIPEDFKYEQEPIIIKINYVGFVQIIDTILPNKAYSYKMDPDEVTLNQVVVTGQYTANSPEKSIHKIKIIDRKQMDSRGVVNLSDALEFETNLRIGQDNALGSSASVQGISGENVKIMIDGVPVVGRQDGSIDLNQINLNNIERIEIVEGPLSVKYGTNALAGTINLISKKDQKYTYETGLNTYYESVGQYNIDARLSWKKGNHNISVSGGRNYFDGWSPDEEYTPLPKSRNADTNRALQWDPKEQYFLNGQYQFNKKEFHLRMFADYFNELITSRGNPRAPYYKTAFDGYHTTNRSNMGFDIGNKLSKHYKWSILSSYNIYERRKETYFKDLTNLEETLTGNPSDHDTSNFNNWMSRGSIIKVNQKVKVNWELGYDFSMEDAKGKRIENGHQQMGDYAGFGSMEWNVNTHLIIKPGLRYAYNTSYEAPLIPSINIRYLPGKTTLRASYAKGFRSPSLKELYFEFVDVNHNIYGNTDLKAETSDNFQFDVMHKFLKGQSITKLEAGIFYNDIKNMITLAALNGGTQYSYTNIGRYKTQGLELSANQSFNHWKISVGFVYTGRSNQLNDSIVSNKMNYSPELRTSVMYEFKKWNGNITLNYKYNGAVPGFTVDDEGTVTETKIEAYHMVDLAFTKNLWKKRLLLTFGGKNLLDVQNIQSTSATGGTHNTSSGSTPVSWGRTFFTSIKLNLGWK